MTPRKSIPTVYDYAMLGIITRLTHEKPTDRPAIAAGLGLSLIEIEECAYRYAQEGINGIGRRLAGWRMP